jgi:threonine dehydratase
MADRRLRSDQLPKEVLLAAERIAPYIRRTPLEYSRRLSRETGANVWLKLENLQHTGSFKARGAFNKLLSLSDGEREAGCVVASSGNHGAAAAHAMLQLGLNGIVFVPEHTSSTKVDAIRESGMEVRFFGTDGLDTELHARAYAESHNLQYLSPYNDADIIAGQGSCGVEIGSDLPAVDAVFVAVGGGGLISGVGAYLKSTNPEVSVVACQPQASPVMTRSVEAGRIVELPGEPTLSDGTAGGIEAGAITFDLCRRVTDDYVLVSEEETAEAMRTFIDAHHMLLEGAAGVALAGLVARAASYRGRNVVVIICGGNISRETLQRVI